ncbi:hypothetical protein C1H46_007728 [Malus baccata]|uniref:Uncharacterized protein n=1 Tax=Malus baccata TaxID=106549 RepID=A0A540N6I4_MALBA|nr:hypothetical protein C1H46_007728 [Malus baccata]
MSLESFLFSDKSNIRVGVVPFCKQIISEFLCSIFRDSKVINRDNESSYPPWFDMEKGYAHTLFFL